MIIFENDRQYKNDKRPFFNDLKKRSIKNVIKKYEALEIYEDIINVVFSIKKMKTIHPSTLLTIIVMLSSS